MEDEVHLPGDGHDPDRPHRAATSRSGARHRRPGARRGELFGIFPEGTRSRDGLLYKGRTGAARLALEIGCPIFPVGIVGTDAIQPPGAKAPKPFKHCSITIGRPVRPERYRDRREPHLAWRSMIDEVMFEIREMTGQAYRNHYAGERVETARRGRRWSPPGARHRSGPARRPERELVGAGR